MYPVIFDPTCNGTEYRHILVAYFFFFFCLSKRMKKGVARLWQSSLDVTIKILDLSRVL